MMPPRSFVILLASALTACAAPAPAARPSQLMPRHFRSAAECVDVVARVRAGEQPVGFLAPSPTQLIVPSREIAQRLRGRTALLRVPVDELGRVDTAGVEVRGLEPYTADAARLRLQIQREWTFRPGVVEGCAVPALWTGRIEY